MPPEGLLMTHLHGANAVCKPHCKAHEAGIGLDVAKLLHVLWPQLRGKKRRTSKIFIHPLGHTPMKVSITQIWL